MPAGCPRRRAPRPSPLHVPLALLCAALAACGPSFSGARADDALPSLVAEHVRRHVPSGTHAPSRRVELSPAGLRVRERTARGDVEIVQDFAHGRLWFVDRGRRVAHAAPTDVPPGTPPGTTTGTPHDAAGERGAPGRGGEPPIAPSASGFLGTRPCGGGASEPVGAGRWRGRRVRAWRCLGPDGARVATELLDVGHGVVVRRETPDGWVDELRDVRPARFAPGHFAPPADHRRVGAHELMRGVPALGSFDEASGAADAAAERS